MFCFVFTNQIRIWVWRIIVIRSFYGMNPIIHPTAFVSEAAYVIGDVEVGEGASIWPGVVIRGDSGKIKIGKFTNIQDNSVVHGDADVYIGDYVVVGHRVMCHGRDIGDRVLIGNGAVINDGVLVGSDSILGSATMVIENMEIPPHSIVMGIPGRIKGTVQQRHMDLKREIAEIYKTKAQKYKLQGDLE